MNKAEDVFLRLRKGLMSFDVHTVLLILNALHLLDVSMSALKLFILNLGKYGCTHVSETSLTSDSVLTFPQFHMLIANSSMHEPRHSY